MMLTENVAVSAVDPIKLRFDEFSLQTVSNTSMMDGKHSIKP
jgi:hypothetical protein